MSTRLDTPSNLETSTGSSVISTLVFGPTFTTPPGFVLTTANLIWLIAPMPGTFMISSNISSKNPLPDLLCGALTLVFTKSPLTITWFLNVLFKSPLILILASIGARTIFLASFASALLMVTSCPIEAPEFLRVVPSILIIDSISD